MPLCDSNHRAIVQLILNKERTTLIGLDKEFGRTLTLSGRAFEHPARGRQCGPIGSTITVWTQSTILHNLYKSTTRSHTDSPCRLHYNHPNLRKFSDSFMLTIRFSSLSKSLTKTFCTRTGLPLNLGSSNLVVFILISTWLHGISRRRNRGQGGGFCGQITAGIVKCMLLRARRRNCFSNVA